MMLLGDLERGTLGTRPLPVRVPERPAGVILVPGREINDAARTFIECLHDHIAGVVARGLAPIAQN